MTIVCSVSFWNFAWIGSPQEMKDAYFSLFGKDNNKDYNVINLSKHIFSVAFTGNNMNDFVTIIAFHQSINPNVTFVLV